MSNPFANYDPGEERNNRKFEPAKILINGSEQHVVTFLFMRRNSQLGIDQQIASIMAIPTYFDLEEVDKYMDGTKPLSNLNREGATTICQVGVGAQNQEGGFNFDAEELNKIIFYFPDMFDATANEVLFDQSSKIIPAVREAYNSVLSKLIDMREEKPELIKCISESIDCENGRLLKYIYFKIESVMGVTFGNSCKEFINTFFSKSEIVEHPANTSIVGEDQLSDKIHFGPQTCSGVATLC